MLWYLIYGFPALALLLCATTGCASRLEHSRTPLTTNRTLHAEPADCKSVAGTRDPSEPRQAHGSILMTSFWYLFTSPAFLGPLKREKPPPWVSLSFVSLSGLVKAHNPSKVTISENQKTQKSNSLQPKKFFRSPVSTTTQAFFLFSLLCGQPLIKATTLPLPTAAPPCATTVLTVGQFPFSPDFLCYFLSELNSLHNCDVTALSGPSLPAFSL